MAVAQYDVIKTNAFLNTVNGDEFQNVYHLRYLSAASATEADVLTDILEFMEALYAILKPLISTLVAIDRIRAINFTSNSDIGETPFVTNVAGTNTSDTGPQQIALGITLKTADLSVRGRKFIGPLAENKVENYGILNSTVATPAADAIVQLITGKTASSGREYVFGVVRSADGVFLPFNAGVVSGNAVTQRRRRGGIGT